MRGFSISTTANMSYAHLHNKTESIVIYKADVEAVIKMLQKFLVEAKKLKAKRETTYRKLNKALKGTPQKYNICTACGDTYATNVKRCFWCSDSIMETRTK
jgi:hypothetical protein